MSVDNCEKFVDLLGRKPEMPLEEVRDNVFGEVYGKHDVGRVSHKTWEALGEACMDRQMYYQDLVENVLKKNG